MSINGINETKPEFKIYIKNLNVNVFLAPLKQSKPKPY